MCVIYVYIFIIKWDSWETNFIFIYFLYSFNELFKFKVSFFLLSRIRSDQIFIKFLVKL